jgi:hypothetical protein
MAGKTVSRIGRMARSDHTIPQRPRCFPGHWFRKDFDGGGLRRARKDFAKQAMQLCLGQSEQ